MDDSLLDEITPIFGTIIERYGFEKTKDVYDSEHFGNAVLIFQSPDFKLRFVRDRSQLLVYIAPRCATGQWHHLKRFLEVVRGADTLSHEPMSFDEQTRSLQSNIERVKELLLPENYGETAARLDRLSREGGKTRLRDTMMSGPTSAVRLAAARALLKQDEFDKNNSTVDNSIPPWITKEKR